VHTMSPLGTDEPGTAAQRERRRRIVHAATALASHGGFERVQMRVVAEQADVALGTLYRYFPSKIHLLVSVLADQLQQAREAFDRRPPPGATPADRVTHVLSGTTRALQRDPDLTEALTRAYMFADASVANEIQVVATQVTHMLVAAMRDASDPAPPATPSEQDLAVVKVIGDVWFASLVQWVTGRISAADVAASMDVAVRLLLR
jgi:AcrR family transcriptional regulator